MDFYFNSANITNPVEGSVASGNFTAADTTTHPGLLIDNDLKLSTNFAGSTLKGVRFATESWTPAWYTDIEEKYTEIDDTYLTLGYGGGGRADYLIVYREDTSNNPSMEVWSSDNPTTDYTKIFDDTIESGNKFSINSITGSSGDYFVVQFKGSYDINVCEILLAEGVTSVLQYDTLSKNTIDNLLKSSDFNGGKMTNKIDDIKHQIILNWDGMNQTQTNKIKTLNNGVDGIHRYFVVVDNNARSWNQLNASPLFHEIAYQYHSTNLNMTRN